MRKRKERDRELAEKLFRSVVARLELKKGVYETCVCVCINRHKEDSYRALRVNGNLDKIINQTFRQ